MDTMITWQTKTTPAELHSILRELRAAYPQGIEFMQHRVVTLDARYAELARRLSEYLDELPSWVPDRDPCTLVYTSNWPRFHGWPASGLVLRHAEDIRLRNVRCEPAPGDPRPLYFCEHTRALARDGRRWNPDVAPGVAGGGSSATAAEGHA